jgi:flagellar biosynthesis chaperone FliJ
MEDFEDEGMQKLLDRQQELKKKLVQAHRAGMSNQIVGQIQSLIEQVEFEIYNKSELDKLKYNQDRGNDDDDDFIIG